MVSSTLQVFRMYEENSSEGLWGRQWSKKAFLEGVILEPMSEGSIGVSKALDSSSSLCTSKCHQYQVALDHPQSSSIYLFCKLT